MEEEPISIKEMEKSADPFNFSINCCDFMVEEDAEDIEAFLQDITKKNYDKKNCEKDGDIVEVIEIDDDSSPCDSVTDECTSNLTTTLVDLAVGQRAEFNSVIIRQDIEAFLQDITKKNYDKKNCEKDGDIVEVIEIDDDSSSCDVVTDECTSNLSTTLVDLAVGQRAEFNSVIIKQDEEAIKENSQVESLNIKDDQDIIIYDDHRSNDTSKSSDNLPGNVKEHDEPVLESTVYPDVYSCEKCGEEFTEKVDLLIHHKTIHLGIYALSCNVCKKTFRTIQNLVTHKNTLHKLINSYYCRICKRSFRFKRHLMKHNKKVHEQNYHCDTCSKTFRLKIHLFNHQLKTHTQKTNDLNVADYSIQNTSPDSDSLISCKICRKSFPSSKSLSAHNRIHKNFQLRQKLDLPVELAHQQIHATCAESSIQTIDSSDKTVNQVNKQSKLFSCNICQKSFTSYRVFCSHRRNHLSKYPFCCKICCKYFQSKRKLVLHVELAHQQINSNRPETVSSCEIIIDQVNKQTKLFSCKMCRKSFTSSRSLSLHNRFHIRKYPFSCKICPKNFLLKENFDLHMESHQQIGPPCSETSEETVSSCEITVNQAIKPSSNKEDFQCDRCMEYFKTKQGLILHLSKMHNSNNPHLCKMCKKTFRLEDKLKDHISIFHQNVSLKSNVETKYADIVCTIVNQKSKLIECDNNDKNESALLEENLTTPDISVKNCMLEDGKSIENNFRPCLSLETFAKSGNSEKSDELPNTCKPRNYSQLKHTCKFCSLTFNHIKTLIDHQKKEHNKKFHKVESHRSRPFHFCKICKEKFLHEKKLLLHLKLIHHQYNMSPELSKSRIRPNDMSKPMSNFSLVNCKQQVHKGAKIYVCKICKKSCINKKKLRFHLYKIHYNDSFLRKSSKLLNHEIKASNEQPLKSQSSPLKKDNDCKLSTTNKILHTNCPVDKTDVVRHEFKDNIPKVNTKEGFLVGNSNHEIKTREEQLLKSQPSTLKKDDACKLLTTANKSLSPLKKDDACKLLTTANKSLIPLKKDDACKLLTTANKSLPTNFPLDKTNVVPHDFNGIIPPVKTKEGFLVSNSKHKPSTRVYINQHVTIKTREEQQLLKSQSSPLKKDNACKISTTSNTSLLTDFSLDKKDVVGHDFNGIIPPVKTKEGVWVCNSLVTSRSNDRINRKAFLCDVCMMSFDLNSSLLFHQNQAHNKIYLYMCKICKNSFNSNTDLSLHQKNVHRKRKLFDPKSWQSSFGSEPIL